MAWEEWFSDFKVPRDVMKLVNAGLLRDTTLPYSLSPNFSAVLSDGRILVFHVDHPQAGRRIGQEKRFGLTVSEPFGFSEPLLETDNLGAAMEALRAILRTEGGPRMGDTVPYWIPMHHFLED